MAKKGSDKQLGLPVAAFEDASLAEEARRRYLNYALSVITSRALPDVRDGMKPVHRRILYTMMNELRVRHDDKPMKCARVVGEVMGKFHPHGDSAIYDALVRMAQSFSMRLRLVDGRGNFGSADGDPPAAMRYTEARLTILAEELMNELGSRTVDFRPNYDGTRFEPIVLPARFPNVLVNGSYGIAVGMATSIPPHNLSEVIKACVAMIDEPNITLKKILKHVRGPDFPTGGQLVCSRAEIESAYATGQGSLKLRAEWTVEERKRAGPAIIVTSIPFATERRTIVEKIAEVVISKKLPVLVDVRDESTDDCRIVCEIKKDADPQLVMSYLFKHTPLSQNVQVNLTCLVPTENREIAAPKRLSLPEMIRYFLDFRMEVTERRLRYELEELQKRIHILEGFAIVFDALDETIRIIRKSEGRKDAAEKLMKRFSIDQEQVDAILELRLYKLARLEILIIQEELEAKRKESKRIQKLLKSEPERWNLIRAELADLGERYPDTRKTAIIGEAKEPEFDEEAFIVEEDAMIVLTSQGWVKRQQKVRDVSATRVREGDTVLEIAAGSTRASIAFFSNHGTCYTTRIVDIQATTGYGVPVQTLFKMDDGERMVAMTSFDPRFNEVPPATEGAEEPEPPYAIAVTAQGMSMRFSLRPFRETSTRAGRKFTRPRNAGKPGGDEVVYVGLVETDDQVACATSEGRALICAAEEVSLLAGAGMGVKLIKLGKTDTVVGARVLKDEEDALVVENSNQKKIEISTRRYEVVSRAGKGIVLMKRGRIERVIYGEPTLPGFEAPEEGS